jgi:hypothetical protein
MKSIKLENLFPLLHILFQVCKTVQVSIFQFMSDIPQIAIDLCGTEARERVE